MDPFKRTQAQREQQSQEGAKKQKQQLYQKKSREEIRVELSRMVTKFKLRSINVLRTLDANFFARFAVFIGLLYYLSRFSKQFEASKQYLAEPDRNSPNRFSKTFGTEKEIDQILEQMRNEEKEQNTINKENIKLL
ncbi:UNKNOWN [Stylonychia lemnae]|uniref:Transmembrane protein n=1 Tax=Stylonychia lemnae TaxID=5949 RepID=A0A078ANN4_STYLE|nr:UNKNOWN [Stylonychia lemnae]|eukprot:CDW83955.1 UNKNOWN [Stylonychia lemnae]